MKSAKKLMIPTMTTNFSAGDAEATRSLMVTTATEMTSERTRGKLGGMGPPWLGGQGPSAARFRAALSGVSPITRDFLLWQVRALLVIPALPRITIHAQ